MLTCALSGDLRNIVISRRELRAASTNVMPASTLMGRVASSSFLSELQPAGEKPDPLRENTALFPPLGEPAIALKKEEPPTTAAGRRRIWDFDTHLHCSIIGTCLSTGELRQILAKLGRREATTSSEHDLHASGVLLANQRNGGAKLLHKALDRRHRISINHFNRAKTTQAVRAAWKEAVQRGEIPGAYWAALTHPATGDGLVREIFAEVHMLSHLVGAANRADIRRLRQLETDKAELEARVSRQQQQLCDAIVSRDTTIQQLRRALEQQIARDRNGGADHFAEPDRTIFLDLTADLKRRLAAAESRCESLKDQLKACRSALAAERNARSEIEKKDRELRRELDEIEASLAHIAKAGSSDPETPCLSELTLLYVGGRQAQIGHLREFAERSGATFLHHDGGLEERSGMLQGLVSRANAVLFPVDCVSHAAMLQVKRLCSQTGKPILPLRSAGLASFCVALNECASLVPLLSPKQDV